MGVLMPDEVMLYIFRPVLEISWPSAIGNQLPAPTVELKCAVLTRVPIDIHNLSCDPDPPDFGFYSFVKKPSQHFHVFF